MIGSSYLGDSELYRQQLMAQNQYPQQMVGRAYNVPKPRDWVFCDSEPKQEAPNKKLLLLEDA